MKYMRLKHHWNEINRVKEENQNLKLNPRQKKKKKIKRHLKKQDKRSNTDSDIFYFVMFNE